MKPHGLGKGLDALFAENSSISENRKQTVSLSEVTPNKDQPRKSFEDSALFELADSIRKYGIMQPLIVRRTEGGYQIVAGERRYRAARLAGLSEIPVNVIDISDKELMTYALVENLQRENLDAVEEARGFKTLSQSGLTQEQIAVTLSKSRSYVANSLRLLELPEEVLKEVIKGTLSAAAARTVIPLKENPAVLIRVVREIVENALPVRRIEALVKEILNGERLSKKEKVLKPREISLVEIELSLKDIMNRKIEIKGGTDGGKITVNYNDYEDLKDIADCLSKIKNKI